MRIWKSLTVFLGGLLLVVLSATAAAGSGRWNERNQSVVSVSAASASGASGQSGPPGSANITIVSCVNDTCEVTLGGDSTVSVLGSTFRLQDIRHGRAFVRVDHQVVSGAPGETVSVDSLTMRFTSVREDRVSFTVSR
jgi:hypothetical protein